jgi:hypothetical protein
MKKRRRPNGWDKIYRNGPMTAREVLTQTIVEGPSAFEQKLQELRIREDQAAKNRKMLAWIRANHTRHHVPEYILCAVGLNHVAWDGLRHFERQRPYHRNPGGKNHRD